MAITPNKSQIEAAGLEYIEPHEIVADTGPRALNLLAQAVVDGAGGVDEAEVRAIVEGMKLGGGVETISGTVALDGSDEPIREFYTTGATTFKANGADTLVGSHTAVVWRRDGAGSWSYQQVVDGWVTPAATPDTTAPTAGTLNVTTTHNSASLSVMGASDNRGVTGYAFSSNGGLAWTGWQSGSTYDFTGLTQSTSYTFRHKVRDAAGNEAQGAPVTKDTMEKPAEPPSRSAIEASIIADSPIMWLPMQDDSLANQGSVAATGTATGTVASVAMPDGGIGRQFDGVDDRINTQVAVASAPFTMEATFVSNGGDGYMIGNTGSYTPQLGNKTIGVRGSGDVYLFASAPTGVATHLALTFDGATLRRYQNGVETHQQAASGTGAPDGAFYLIGGRTNATDRQFNGIIRDAAAYATALSVDRILAHAQAQGVA